LIEQRIAFVRANYEMHDWRHAIAVLSSDFPNEWSEILEFLSGFRLRRSHILQPGGSKSLVAGALDGDLIQRGWACRSFATKIRVDDQEHDAPTHAVDCFKNRVGLEVEWNNKDPFFDRDFNNFRLLFELRALSVGIIVTRCDELQSIFNQLGRGTSYGNSTTHMSKLLPRLHGGSGGGCPILAIGISKSLYVED
jgi:hypothetical protein